MGDSDILGNLLWTMVFNLLANDLKFLLFSSLIDLSCAAMLFTGSPTK